MRMRTLVLVLGTFAIASAALWSQEREPVAVVESDASRDESALTVRFLSPIKVNQEVLIETQDGKVRDQYEAKHLYGNQLVLKQRLRHDFVSG